MISISQIIVTAENPRTPFFENQGPSFFVSNYSKPKIKVTVESDSEIVSYSYFGSLLGNDSSTPFVTSSSEYIGPIIQTAEESLYVTVSVTNSNGEIATQSSSFVTIQEYTLPSITDIEYIVGDWIQSPTGYEWQDNPGGTSLKVSCFVHLSLDDIALNPPNSCTVQFLINDWVYVTSNNYQTGIPEVVAVLSDVISGKNFDLSVRVRDSISGWIRQTVTVSASGGDVIPISLGGTGATNASDARENLGLGTIATVDSPIPIANGGTGRTTALAAIRNLIATGCTEYNYRTTTTSNDVYDDAYGVQKIYTANQDGIAAITCSIWVDKTSDYGAFKAQIFVNNVERSKSQWRMDNAQTQIMGASASLICKISQGQQIKMNLGSSHNGTKTCEFTVVAIGCTLS